MKNPRYSSPIEDQKNSQKKKDKILKKNFFKIHRSKPYEELIELVLIDPGKQKSKE